MLIPVYLFDLRVGQLQKKDSSYTFTYTTEWLEHPKAHGISHSLPLREKPYKRKECLPYFSGLLPEETLYNHFCSEIEEPHASLLDLFQHFGFDCKGAIRFKEDSPQPQSEFLNPQDLEALIHYIPIDPHFIKTHSVASFLPGKQAKATITLKDQFFCKPASHFISTHIIKTDFNTQDQRILNEVFCSTLAKKVRLNVSKMTYMPFQDLEAFVVERFDRLMIDHDVIPIHCEDFCQALGCLPEHKHEVDGGPGYKDCLDLLKEKSSLPIIDVRSFVDSLFFNLLIGNNAAHGKNYSLIYSMDGIRLSPMYDVMSTEIYSASPMAMSINNKFSFYDIKLKDIEAFCEHTQIGKNYFKNRLISFAQFLPTAADAIINKNSLLHASTIIQKIRTLLNERCQHIGDLLLA